MAQTPAATWQDGFRIDYTPGVAVPAGSVVLLGNVPLTADLDIPANTLGALSAFGVKKVPKVTGVAFAAGDTAYWNPTASPVVGDASSGAVTNVAAGGYVMGMVVYAAASGDAYAYVRLSAGAAMAGSFGRTPVNADVAAAGSTQADAAQLFEGFTCVTGGDGTKGVILPTAVPGMRVELKNMAGAAILKVYPKTGGAINAIAANGAISMAAVTSAIFIAKTATQWYTIPLLPS